MSTSPFAVPCERIAITGIGCRLPGHANDHRTYWRNLIEGRDCLTDTPADRYDTGTLGSRDRAKPGRLIGGRGGYIDGFDTFDPDFFGISPREAEHMDPQQRKLLEVSWEALEDGGLRPGELAGRDVGVYMGAFTLDWKILQFADLDFGTIAAHTATGTMMTMVSNRISHCFDFRGPSVSIDTACSSSLVAVHLACQSLLRGETELALAGGALLHMAPQYTIAETKGGFLSADGRSRAFDASADGYVRAEGVGVVVLKRLSDALRDGDPVHAVILGSGVNQDGRTNGITVPSADAQVTLIERVCAEAGVAPGSLQYVEAHGTSTPVGDPIEAAALGRVLGVGRRSGDRCYVGSVKTNIGHTEAAAGVAGLIKTVLALKHRRIPPHLNLERPNPAIDLDALPFVIPTTPVDWPEHQGPARAGVNSFGFGGTNAHVLLEEPPAPAPAAPAPRPTRSILPLSARDAAGLPELAAAIRRELAAGTALADLGHTLAHRRQHLPERLAVVYSGERDLGEALAAHERGEAHPQVVQGHARERQQRRLAWVFTGMGPQWWGMGRGLYESEPVYREAVRAVDREIREQAGWSLLDELGHDEADSRMAETWLAQPANFALQVGLSALWRSHGLRPDAVVGHSTGEVAAFHEAGVYDLADAVRVVLARSGLQQRLAGTGAMLAVGLPEAEAERRIRPYRTRLSLAAVNSPSAVTLAGDTGALRELAGELQQQGVFARFLDVEVPYHSVRMDPIKDELIASLAGIKPRDAQLPLYLTAQEGLAQGPELDGEYWWRNVRRPVRFRAAVERMAEDGHRLFLELGPHPVLGHAIRECAEQAHVLASIRRQQDEPERLTRTLAELHTLGVELSWDVLHPAGRPVPLPTYPWRRDRYWVEPEPVEQVRLGRVDHPLLGRRTAAAQPSWTTALDPERLPYLDDHRIEGQVVFPAAGYLEMAAQAVRALTGGTEVVLAEVELNRALFLSDTEPVPVQLGYAPEDARFTIASTPPGGEPAVHASGRVRTGQRRAHRPAPDLDALRARGRHLDGPDCYRRLSERGYDYGPAFQAIAEVWAGPGEALAWIRPTERLGPDAADHHLHPVLLDACFQTLLATRLHTPEGGSVRLPVSIEEVRLDEIGDRPLWAHATVTRDSGEELVGDLALYAEDGTPLGRITGFRVADVAQASASVGLATIDGWLTELAWTDAPTAPLDQPTGDLLLFADAGGLAERLAALAAERGARSHLVRPGTEYSFTDGRATVRPDSAEDLRRLFADLDPGCTTVAHLWNLDLPALDTVEPGRLDRLATLGAYSLITLAQALPAARPDGRLHIVTRGTQAAGPGDRVEPLGAPAWGIGRVLWQQELVAHRGSLIDLDPALAPHDQAEALLAELAAGDEQELALRGGRRLTSRLRRAEGLTRPLPPVLRPDGSYLVTGAFGALGRLLCRTLVRRGARRLILVGRTALPERAEWRAVDPASPVGERIAFLRELEALGAEPLLAPVDVTDEAALARWLAGYRQRQLPPIRGVFHLAGQVKDTLLAQMDRAAFDTGYAPKVIGGHLLHRLLRDEPLDHFVLFASVASLLTTAGQTNYAAGNAFLDALAHHRRADGLPALSLDWGPWATGMIEELGLVAHYRDARGMSSLPPDAGTAVLERVLGQDRAQLLVATVVDWPTFLAWYPAPPPLVAELAAEAAEQAPAETGGFLDAYRAADPQTRRQLIAERFTAAAAAVLRIGAERIDEQTRLGAHGLDSLLAMELRARVHGELGVALPVVALLSNGSVGDLVDLLAEGLAERLDTEGGEEQAEVELHTDESRYPLTHNQQALWFLRLLHPDGFAYNIGGAVEVRAELDPELVFAAFAFLVARHPGLRAAFTAEEGRPVQRIRAEVVADTGLFDVEGRPWEEIHELIVREYRRPYDLAQDPLVRLRLFRRGPDRWVLMKAVHHIVSDAISTFTFIEELFEVYEALRQGRTPELPPVAARYLDFLNHQNRFLAGPQAQRMLDYWRGHLPAGMPVLALPTDKPRPAVQTHNGASEFFRLDDELTARVHELARANNATPFMVLLSAYYLLLHRWSGQPDIVVGSPVTGRTQEEFSSVYGYFVNPLPLHVSLAGEPTVAGLLARVRESVLGGLDNQEYPFPLLVEQLGLQHDPSRSAVFQAMFILLTHKVAVERFGYRLEYIELPEEEGQFDLTLSAYEDRSDGCFHCVFKYNSDLFEPATVQRLAAHYRNLLDAMTRAGESEPVGRLRMLDTAERHRILTGFSGAGRRIDHDVPVPELIAKAAAEHPEAVAVVAPGRGGVRRMTYGELDQRSQRLAVKLRELGVGERSVVAVCLDKSPELITTLLAIWRAGAAYLPLDPGHPVDRLAHQVSDAGAALVVVDERRPFTAELPAVPVTLEELERPAHTTGPLPAADPDRPAYVIHTSGSTGRPKGVRVDHRNLAAVTAGWREEYRLDTEARVHLQMAGTAFDVFSGDLARALSTGGTLVLVDRELLFDTARLYRVMREEAVDCGEFVPAVARALMAHCEREGLRLDFLRLLIVGSDAWKAAEHQRLRALCGERTRLVNSYGLTEATVDSSYYEGTAGGLEPGRMVPIGRPFPNSALYILDRYGEPVPAGVPGELWIGGAGVAAGYPGDREQTERRFTTLEFDGTPLRLYRTGDLGHWDTEGTAHLLGRIDNQVKVRGHRIEPGEIEAHLTARPELAQACVAVRQDGSGEAVLAAYVVPAEGVELDRRELRRHLAEHLPTVMIPSYLTELPALPLTPNGKVDLAALPEPKADTGGERHEPPVTLYEVRVAEHWRNLLGLDEVGLQHDFFELGGSSIRLIELIHHLQTEFNISIPVGQLFKVTTLHGMARTVEQIITGEVAGGEPYLWFNARAPHDRTVFCFPPAGGHGLVYRQLAAHLPEQRIAAFNYLTGEDKTARYADLVEALHPAGPYVLLGYSLGGNLAFEVAKELERRGRTVSSVLLVDAYRAVVAYELGEEHLAVFERELHEHLHRHTGSRIVARETLEQARDYLEFCSRTPNTGTVKARLDVVCERERLSVHAGGEDGSWHGASTTGTAVYAGHGDHAEMLDGEFAERNAELAGAILAGGTADGRG
ncbi:non-ribosomal peptide synthetase/type I polyketide synthase [Kitasatospora sp. SUK 42]|uniref:non-ribosomal peptide synthetase/type I polyketide synthase n=1 Tax=Kitasatospora sp. SUK 42 TaxID=1588882 RepID=UPI0018CA4012|nr:non-ribosomal peptide synthetase/type I polyketide synthase [Kitasatospora sp. SUK 42]MBV2155597.1 amino acid adenylation domain-containing protein [Kitasatospora sp. SUK 42]